MSCELRYKSEARASAVAHFLAGLEYWVLWDPKGDPHVIKCSCGRKQITAALEGFKGVDERWPRRTKIKTGAGHEFPNCRCESPEEASHESVDG